MSGGIEEKINATSASDFGSLFRKLSNPQGNGVSSG
ncbi:MAG: hypothetical protein ACI857_003310 [Arenicella sp.]|jgi:hypothetical protein